MNDWSHGYNVSMGYSFGFYREMAPDWLDLCTWIGGFEPPARVGRPYRYLELGCGQGFGLCLLAAANPEAEFVGVDFQPEHIAHANRLAEAGGVANVRFVRADFLDLARQWPGDFGAFDYVTLHGIISYLSRPLLTAVIDCIAHAAAPGALVYVSYNALPGCLSSVPLQHFARRMKEIGKQSEGAAPAQAAIRLLDTLAAANAPVFKVLPALKARVDAVAQRDSNYLVHEYLSDNWNLFWHSEVAREMRRAGLEFVASATLADNLTLEFLPEALRQPILEQQGQQVRQDLQDIVINQAFRRDIFCRDRQAVSTAQDGKDRLPLHLANAPADGQSMRFETSFGQIEWAPAVFDAVVHAVAAGPQQLDRLFRLPNATAWKPRHVLLLLLHANVLAPQAAATGDPAVAQRLNAVIARESRAGAPYEFLAASRLGSAVRASPAELRLLDEWLSSGGQGDSGLLPDMLPRWRRLGVVA